MVGRTLSHYRVLELLGRGGMGEVYAAEDTRLRRRVALKVLPPAMAADPERRRRFEREAQAIAALNHPGIVTIHAVEHYDGVTFLAMELVEGRTLAGFVPPGGLPLDEFRRIAIPLTEALNAAHERGILHRDLKPGNVMVTPDGRVKILDFGLAKLTEPAAAESAVALPLGPNTTSDGQIVGTLSYMAPEQAEGKVIDNRADIFALGVLLYELASGTRPFAGDTNVSILTSLLRDTPRPVTELRRDFPGALGAIIQHCLEKDPARRYAAAADVRRDLEALGATRARRPRAETPRWAYAASAVIVLLTGMGVWWTFSGGPTRADTGDFADTAASPVLITGRQVALLDFENRTGDPAFETFGRMAREAIAGGLGAHNLPVVGANVASAADGVTVVASYSVREGQLRFDARILSASRGTVVRNVETVIASPSSLLLAADEAQRRVVAAIVATLDSQPTP